MFATLLEFCHSHINTSISTHSADKKIGKRHATQILNILMPVCLLVCKCSFCFSPEFLFQQDTICLHECKQILLAAVVGCSTMQSVLWPNAPLIGGWALGQCFSPHENTYLYGNLHSCFYGEVFIFRRAFQRKVDVTRT